MSKRTNLAPYNHGSTSGIAVSHLLRLSNELIIHLVKTMGNFFPSVMYLKAVSRFFASSKSMSCYRTQVLFHLWLVQSNIEIGAGCLNKVDCSKRKTTLTPETIDYVLAGIKYNNLEIVNFDLTEANHPAFLAFSDLPKVETFSTGPLQHLQGGNDRLQKLHIDRCPKLTQVFVNNCDGLEEVYISQQFLKPESLAEIWFTLYIASCKKSVAIAIQLNGFELKVESSPPNCSIHICIRDTIDGLQYDKILRDCV